MHLTPGSNHSRQQILKKIFILLSKINYSYLTSNKLFSSLAFAISLKSTLWFILSHTNGSTCSQCHCNSNIPRHHLIKNNISLEGHTNKSISKIVHCTSPLYKNCLVSPLQQWAEGKPRKALLGVDSTASVHHLLKLNFIWLMLTQLFFSLKRDFILAC